MNKNPQVSLHIRLITRPTVRIVYLRYQGPFGRALGDFWQTDAMPWIVAHGLAGGARYGISQDNPETTEAGQCRYDAGVEVDEDFQPPPGSHVTTLPGGLCACVRFCGTSPQIAGAWKQLLREWLPGSGYELDGRPCFEYYAPDMDDDEKTGAFCCELCLPVRKQPH